MRGRQAEARALLLAVPRRRLDRPNCAAAGFSLLESRTPGALAIVAWVMHVGRLVQALRIPVELGSTISVHFSDLGATDISRRGGVIGLPPLWIDVAFVKTGSRV